jgi:integrase
MGGVEVCAGLPHITWRLLRHWGTTLMVERRVPLKAAQQRLVHSRPDILLEHYAYVLDESVQFAATTLSSKVSEKGQKRPIRRRFRRQLAAKRQPAKSSG